MIFLAVSQHVAETCPAPNEKHIYISIRDSLSDIPVILKNSFTTDILYLQFDDDEKSFSIEQAKQISSFISKHLSICSLCIIHCLAGVSRSAGVAAALSNFYLDDDFYFFKNKCPNMHIYRTLLNILNEKL